MSKLLNILKQWILKSYIGLLNIYQCKCRIIIQWNQNLKWDIIKDNVFNLQHTYKFSKNTTILS